MEKMKFKMLLACLLVSVTLFGCSANNTQNDETEAVEKIEQVAQVEQKQVKVATQHEKEYAGTLEQFLDSYEISVDRIIEKLDEAVTDSSKTEDKVWLEDFQFEFDKIHISVIMLKQMEADGLVPDSFKKVHSTTIESLELMVEAGDYLIKGIKDKDKSYMNIAGDLMGQSGDKMIEVGDLMSEKIKEYSK